MHSLGPAAEVRDRLMAAGLMPPVRSLQLLGAEEDETVTVGVVAPLADADRERIAEALRGLTYDIEEVSPREGVIYGRPGRRRVPSFAIGWGTWIGNRVAAVRRRDGSDE